MKAIQNNKGLVSFGICIFIAYLLPYHVHPFRAFYNDWIVLFGATVLFAYTIERRWVAIRLPWIAVIPAFLAIWILWQVFLGMLTVSWDAIPPVAYFLYAALACALGATVGAEKEGAYRLCAMLAMAHLFAAIVSLGIATLQFIGAEGLYGDLVVQQSHSRTPIRPFANVAQPNQLALLFCMGTASVWWLFQAGRVRGIVAFAIVLFLLWGLALTQSRIGWLIIPALAIVVSIWSIKHGFARISRLVILVFVFVYSLFVFTLANISSFFGGSAASPAERIGTHSERVVLFQQAVDASAAKPLFGSGWYEFGPVQLAIGADYPPSTYSQHAHNAILNFAVEVGWPATFAVFGVLTYWFFTASVWRQISKEVAFAILFLIAVFVHSLVEFPLWYAYVLLPTALLLGMVHHEQFGSKVIRLSRVHVSAVAIVVSIGLVIVAIDYRRVVVGFRALGMHSFGFTYEGGTTDRPEFTVFPHFYDYFLFAKTRARKEMTDAEIIDMERVARRFGYAPVLMRMSLVYALNGRSEDAYKSLMTINRLHPGDYADAYAAWENMVVSDPASYKVVFNKLPRPGVESTFVPN